MKKKKSEATHRAHVIYSGRVQGVGFRYTAEKMALDLGLVGWVKNLPNGSVEIIVEGAKSELETFLSEIQASSVGRHIQKTDCKWLKPTQEFHDFTVEFHL